MYAALSLRVDYGLEVEVAGVLREADARGWERSTSSGIRAAARPRSRSREARPERLASLALLEPARAISRDISPAERAAWLEHERLARLPDDQLMPAFVRRFGLRPGVPVPSPPPGEPPPWMATRPAGIRAILRASHRGSIDREALSTFDRPVYLALCALSNPDHYEQIAKRLSESSPTSSSRCSRSVTISILRTGLSPSASLARSRRSGGARRVERPRPPAAARTGGCPSAGRSAARAGSPPAPGRPARARVSCRGARRVTRA